MKKVALILLTVLSLNFSSCSILNTDKQTISPNEENIAEEVRTEMRGVWLSFFEISDMCKGKSESEYYKNAEEVIKNIKKLLLYIPQLAKIKKVMKSDFVILLKTHHHQYLIKLFKKNIIKL